MIQSRSNGFERLYTQEQLDRLKNSCCPICGCSKNDWKKGRRTYWLCCSIDCSRTHDKINVKIWANVRDKIIERDNSRCVKCGKDRCSFVVDHIKPIALGGSEWDESNMQTLCLKCNKLKTKGDMGLIAVERKQPLSQTRL